MTRRILLTMAMSTLVAGRPMAQSGPVRPSPEGRPSARRAGDARGPGAIPIRVPGAYFRHVIFSPRGDLLAVDADDVWLTLWDAARGRLLRSLAGSSPPGFVEGVAPPNEAPPEAEVAFEPIGGVAFSPDGGLLVAAGPGDLVMPPLCCGGIHEPPPTILNRQLTVFDVKTGRVTRTLKTPTPCLHIEAAAFTPDLERLVTLDLGYAVKDWDLKTGRIVRALGANGLGGQGLEGGLATAFSPDARRVASVAGDDADDTKPIVSTVKFWDVHKGSFRAIREKDFFPETGQCVAFSPDGGMIAVGFSEATTRIFDFGTGEVIRTLKADGDEPVRYVGYGPGGATLVEGGDDGVLRLREAPSGRLLQTIRGPVGPIRAVAFFPGRLRVASEGARPTPEPVPGKDVRLEILLWLWEVELAGGP